AGRFLHFVMTRIERAAEEWDNKLTARPSLEQLADSCLASDLLSVRFIPDINGRMWSLRGLFLLRRNGAYRNFRLDNHLAGGKQFFLLTAKSSLVASARMHDGDALYQRGEAIILFPNVYRDKTSEFTWLAEWIAGGSAH